MKPMSHRILVVDDDPHIRELLMFALDKAGMRPSEASDGEEALAAIAREMPDLMVLDINMPRLNGLDLCRRLRGGTAAAAIQRDIRLCQWFRHDDSARYRPIPPHPVTSVCLFRGNLFAVISNSFRCSGAAASLLSPTRFPVPHNSENYHHLLDSRSYYSRKLGQKRPENKILPCSFPVIASEQGKRGCGQRLHIFSTSGGSGIDQPALQAGIVDRSLAGRH